ncbi:hypothetical protein [Aeoliella mucimassa]|uniref:Uncharacterized protein n=1 Tax=Aeoliella mucimassa TaxID=2527972 RepID=A0A518AIM8_9BACT|nr:hypothetical protein [Aeoliella mucimassa]QDU54595.1 hypothetical protein Pan181_07780 [Aeoliella mucimassa]
MPTSTKSSQKKTASKSSTAKKTAPKRASSASTAKKRTTKKAAASKKKAPATKKKATTKKTTKKTSTGEEQVTIDRRRGDRREGEVATKKPLERRQKVNRRRQIDPTTCERDYSDQEVEFMNALDDYKRRSGRMFPTCSEVLEVIRGLGYVQLSPAELAARTPADEPNTDTETEAASEQDEMLLEAELVG